jgi:hypothetical protein
VIPQAEGAAPEDDSGAKIDLNGFHADLKVQAAPTLCSDLGNDLISLLKDLTSGNTSAAKADVNKVHVTRYGHSVSSVAVWIS